MVPMGTAPGAGGVQSSSTPERPSGFALACRKVCSPQVIGPRTTIPLGSSHKTVIYSRAQNPRSLIGESGGLLAANCSNSWTADAAAASRFHSRRIWDAMQGLNAPGSCSPLSTTQAGQTRSPSAGNGSGTPAGRLWPLTTTSSTTCTSVIDAPAAPPTCYKAPIQKHMEQST